jgi:hypothetical protein
MDQHLKAKTSSNCKENNIEYQPIQPLWPRANPIAERFIRNLNNTVRCAQVEGKSWRTAWNDFLRHYRATPHSTTGVSPNDAMNLKNELRITYIEKSLNSREIKEKLEKFDKKNKASIKRHADISMKVKENKMKINDNVLVKYDAAKYKNKHQKSKYF